MKPTLTFDLLSRLYKIQDMTISQIADQTGYGSSTIHRKLKKFKLLKNKKQIYDKINRSRIQTFKSKYGCDHYMKSEEGFNRYQQSIIKNYNVDSIMQLDKVKKKQQQTHNERYGVKFSIQNPKSNEKRLNTLKEKYGDYKKHISKRCAETHIATSPHIKLVNLDGKIFKVRSKLEQKTLNLLSKLNCDNVLYEPFYIDIPNSIIIPDLLINHKLIIEIKYSKYLKSLKPKNLDSKGMSMWKSTSYKLPKLINWSNKNGYEIGIITEVEVKKKYLSLKQLISDAKLRCFDYSSLCLD